MAAVRAKSIPKVDPYLESLMAKLLERLVGLEKKIDKVIAQTAGKTSAPQFQVPARQERTLYEAICADCSKVCEVPFKPTEARPVYCKDCWAKRKGGVASRPGMPVLTPVALPPRPASKLFAAPQADSSARAASKKTKKSSRTKKAKKK